jgi:hypothetical protein
MPVSRAVFSLAGSTAPMWRSAERTPARPYSAKSSDVIFGGISTTFGSPEYLLQTIRETKRQRDVVDDLARRCSA